MDFNSMNPQSLNFASKCTTKLELRFSCSNLVNLDTFSKSDPIIVAYMKDLQSGRFMEVGRTEVITDNLNPKFVKAINIDYRFEEVQEMRVVCYDVDNPNLPLEKQDFIGEINCKVSELVTAKEQKYVRELKHPKHPNSKRGTITIISEEIREFSHQLRLQLAGKHLDKKDFFGKSDPFFVISRGTEGNNWVPVIKSEVIKKTLDPRWKAITVPVSSLCNGDYDRPLLFDIYDWNRSGSHELIGNFKTNVRELTSGNKKEFEVIDIKQQKSKRNYKNSGIIQLVTCDLIKSHTFLDYIAGGCEISLIVAIDFTASNGNPQFANSLHYRNPYQPNEYVKSIQSVGSILADYDTDRNFPVYGFGAKIPPTREISHCFPLNGNWSNPEVKDINGIIEVYYRAIDNVELHGPTIFNQILRTVNTIASSHNSQQEQKFNILLIITDGIINDMEQTIDEIVAGSNLPLSIVIVGVGAADFTNMEILDADDAPLRNSAGQFAKRDIVQFVPMVKYRNSDPSLLAKEVLAEIPGQLLSFMQSRGFVPNPPSHRQSVILQQSNYNQTSMANLNAPIPTIGQQPNMAFPPSGYPPNNYPPNNYPPNNYPSNGQHNIGYQPTTGVPPPGYPPVQHTGQPMGQTTGYPPTMVQIPNMNNNNTPNNMPNNNNNVPPLQYGVPPSHSNSVNNFNQQPPQQNNNSNYGQFSQYTTPSAPSAPP